MNHFRYDRRAADRRLSRRAALRGAVGLASAPMVATSFSPGPAAAQETPPAATPAASDLPDLSGVAPLPLTGERLAAFETFVTATLGTLGVPGVAVAVVQGGEIAYLQGFGVREIDHPAPVTADTLLRIGSITKSFSSMLTAILVDAGRLAWETPLIELLPDFAVADPALTPQLTVRDAFCACTGLPRRDLEFMFLAHELTPERLIAEMARIPLTAPFGEKYQYSNQLVAAGGYAAAVADGGAPDDLAHAYAIALRDRVLNPIGMSRSTLSLAEVAAGNDYATPHAPDLDGASAAIPLLLDDEWITPVAPTGGLWSSAREMARYIQTELARGIAPDGTRVVSAENLERTWQPGVPIAPAPGTPALLANTISQYALGWNTGTYGGQRMISHGGGTYGFNSLLAFLPDADLGLVVLTNVNGAGALLATVAQFRLFELLFEQPATIEPLLQSIASDQTARRADFLTHLGPVDPAAVAPFLGRYANADLGALTLALRGESLVFDAGAVRTALRPRLDAAGDVTDYIFVDPPWATVPPLETVTFTQDTAGQPQIELTEETGPGVPNLVYRFEAIEGDSLAP